LTVMDPIVTRESPIRTGVTDCHRSSPFVTTGHQSPVVAVL
jgi:hypothetical protein